MFKKIKDKLSTDNITLLMAIILAKLLELFFEEEDQW